MAATFTHLLLWNRDDISSAWTWLKPSIFKQNIAHARAHWRFWRDEGKRDVEEIKAMYAARGSDVDPHYLEMLKYPDAPNSWYFVTLILSTIIALVVIYKSDSTLPWWGSLISLALGTLSILFFGALYAITGLQFIIQPFVQMIGGFIHPGKPMANMYFVLFSYSKSIFSSTRS